MCDKIYKDVVTLKIHMIGDHQANSIDENVVSNQGRLAKCSVCDKLIATLKSLELHIEKEHPIFHRQSKKTNDENSSQQNDQNTDEDENEVFELNTTVDETDKEDPAVDTLEHHPKIVMVKLRKIMWPAKVLKVTGNKYEVQECGRRRGGILTVNTIDCQKFISSPDLTVAKSKVGLVWLY